MSFDLGTRVRMASWSPLRSKGWVAFCLDRYKIPLSGGWCYTIYKIQDDGLIKFKKEFSPCLRGDSLERWKLNCHTGCLCLKISFQDICLDFTCKILFPLNKNHRRRLTKPRPETVYLSLADSSFLAPPIGIAALTLQVKQKQLHRFLPTSAAELTSRWFPQFYFSLSLGIDRCSACWSRRPSVGWTSRRKLKER